MVQAGRHGLVRAENRQAIYADDTGDVLGVFADGYTIHQYQDWLLDKVASILDDGLSIGSAGLLRRRRGLRGCLRATQERVRRVGVGR